MSRILFACALSGALLLPGRTAARAWAHVLDGPTLDVFHHVTPLPDGSILARGAAWSWGAGGRDHWLVRLRDDGGVAWEIAIGTDADEVPGVAGHDAAGATCLAIDDRVVARIEPDGVLSWAAEIERPVLELDATADGGCVLAGPSEGGAWLARLDASGAMAWARDIPARSPCAGSDVATTVSPAGLGELSDGRLVLGLLSADASTPCGSLHVDLLTADGLAGERHEIGVAESCWGAVRVDPEDALVVSFTRPEGGSCATLTTTLVTDWSGRGLEFTGREDACASIALDGVAGAQAYGARVVTLGSRPAASGAATSTWTVQEHDATGRTSWSRQVFEGVPRHDGTFVAAPFGGRAGRIEVRGPQGEIELGCTTSPATSDASFSGTPVAGWSATSAVAHAVALVGAVPSTVVVTPTRSVRAPACGPCAGSADVRDDDLDGVADACDACPGLWDPRQDDLDGDGLGAACDDCTDVDGDGLGEPGLPGSCAIDTCPRTPDPSNADADGDGVGDACETISREPSALDLDPAAEPLRVTREGEAGLRITWEDVGADEYALRRGHLGMLRVGLRDDEAIRCHLARPEATVHAEAGAVYFLAVARRAGVDSSLGRDSGGGERPSGAACP